MDVIQPLLWTARGFAWVGSSVKMWSAEDHVTSRWINTGSLLGVVAESAIHYAQNPNPADIGSMVTYSMRAARSVTLSMLRLDPEKPGDQRKLIYGAVGFFFADAALTLVAQRYYTGAIDPKSVFILGAVLFDSLADVGTQPFRRRCYILMDMSAGPFGALTGNISLVGKNALGLATNIVVMGKNNELGPLQPTFGKAKRLLKKIRFQTATPH